MLGQCQSQPLEQDRLVLRRLRHAPAPQFKTTSRGQHYLHRPKLGEFFRHPPRLLSHPRPLAELPQRFPQHIGEEAYQDVRLHPLACVEGP